LKAGLLHLQGNAEWKPKDKECRTIPLTKPFRSFLRGYLRKKDSVGFALHPEIARGQWRYRYDFRRPFTDYMRAMDCSWVTPHVMRHTFASLLVSAGVSIYKAAVWMGNDVRVVQQHYAHLAPGDQDIHRML